MKHILLRLLLTIPILWAIYTIAFLMVVTVPGNPFQQPDREIPEAVQRALEARYHIDNNWHYYWEYLQGAVRLDFGPSFQYRDWTCTQIIAASLPVSFALGLTAVLLAVLVGVPVGVLSAVKRNSWFDMGSLALVLIAIYVPFLNEPFGTVPLGICQWAEILPLVLIPSLVAEITKCALSEKK